MPEWYEISVGAVALKHARETCSQNQFDRAVLKGLAFDPDLTYQENLTAFKGRFEADVRDERAWDQFLEAYREGVRRGLDLKYGSAAYGEQSGREREWAFQGQWPAFLDQRLRELDAGPETVLVDVGLNDGREVAHLANPIYGVDVSEPALARGRTLHPHIQFLAGSAERLPLPDESVGLYLALRTFVEKIDLRRATAEAWRVLVPGGGVLVSTPAGHLRVDGVPVLGLTRDSPTGCVVRPEGCRSLLTGLAEALTAMGFVLLGRRETPLETFLLARKPGRTDSGTTQGRNGPPRTGD